MEDQEKDIPDPEQQSEIDKKPVDLKQLAMDLYENKVFTDRHLLSSGNDYLIPSVFMPVALGAFSGKTQEEIKAEVGMIYEYYSEAGPRGINGYPCFFSFRILSPEDTEKMFKYYDDYSKIKEAFAKME